MHVYQDSTVEEAIDRLNRVSKTKAVQPLLFKLSRRYFVKVDNAAIEVCDVGCFAEAVEFLFMCFYVFSVSYPSDLRLFYGFFEVMLGMKLTAGKSSILSGLMYKVKSKLTDTE